MDYTILQIAADVTSVRDALTTLAPGWPDGAATAHAQGWTTVPLDAQAAGRFAPLLARMLRRGVLVWTVDSEHCRVSLFRTNGEVAEAADHPDQVAALREVFEQTHVLVSSTDDATDSDDDKRALAASASDPRRPATQRHRAFAHLLGVPYVVPAEPPARTPTAPALTGASLPLGADQFRRRQRIRTARSWLHLVSGLALVAIVGMVVRGPWIGIPIALVVIAVLQLVRYLLGRSLPPEATYTVNSA
ncbi:hypothetical protein [Actinopolymorpha pittospori]|uniref:Uncharacterized protein n=1 Tax=Actinopolymorpha pittospori TaxID=648752 RepID=A0A927MTJ1_9ACTN|nr:hypothetical protein [Actinopolymorpha pittospori]MBE1604558.1 hypothetical protein [Actinopolymorpha pittospori]